MFIEPGLYGDRRGWIEVICGSMFSGKTEELIRRLKRARIANLRVKIFKPLIDIRYNSENIVSHDENEILSTPLHDADTLLQEARNTDVIGIDEAQFFDDRLPDVCEQLASQGVRVIVAGLDMDFSGKPFGEMPFLLARADFITKLHAICVRCGNIANFSFRKSKQDSLVVLGQEALYEPRCRPCYHLGMDAQDTPEATDKK